MKTFGNILLITLSLVMLCASAVICAQWIYSWFDNTYNVDSGAGLFALGFIVFALSESLKH